jgi:hypothetical protein
VSFEVTFKITNAGVVLAVTSSNKFEAASSLIGYNNCGRGCITICDLSPLHNRRETWLARAPAAEAAPKKRVKIYRHVSSLVDRRTEVQTPTLI